MRFECPLLCRRRDALRDEAQGAYQYDGQEYSGRNEHVGAFDTCTECHNTHELEVEVEECGDCHEGVETKEDLQAIRVSER